MSLKKIEKIFAMINESSRIIREGGIDNLSRLKNDCIFIFDKYPDIIACFNKELLKYTDEDIYIINTYNDFSIIPIILKYYIDKLIENRLKCKIINYIDFEKSKILNILFYNNFVGVNNKNCNKEIKTGIYIVINGDVKEIITYDKNYVLKFKNSKKIVI